MKKTFTRVELLIVVVILGILSCFLIGPCVGAAGFGPKETHHVKVLSKHVDSNKDGSSFMVTTSDGVFEVGNGPLLGVWNADEIYGQLLVDHEYDIVTKGRKVVKWWIQEYPYIVEVRTP